MILSPHPALHRTILKMCSQSSMWLRMACVNPTLHHRPHPAASCLFLCPPAPEDRFPELHYSVLSILHSEFHFPSFRSPRLAFLEEAVIVTCPYFGQWLTSAVQVSSVSYPSFLIPGLLSRLESHWVHSYEFSLLGQWCGPLLVCC